VLPVAVRCRLGRGLTQWALWDTASSWSAIGSETAAVLRAELGPAGAPMIIRTRFGRLVGTPHRLPVTLLASHGPDLTLDATCLVLGQEWEGPTVLGVRGFMERLRFALDLAESASARPMLALGVSRSEESVLRAGLSDGSAWRAPCRFRRRSPW